MKFRAQNHLSCEFPGPSTRSKAFTFVATLLVIFASAALSSCLGYTVSPTAIGQPTNPSTAAPGAGVLTPGSASLDFGDMAVGGAGTQSVSLTNTGTAAVNISNATISGGAAFTVVGANPSGKVPVGQSASVKIQFAPKSDSAATASLTITSDASDSPLTIPLSGIGTQAQLSATPSSINFGTVVKGTSNSQTITLQNTGNTPLTFSQVTPSGTGFTITGISTSTVIPPGGSVTFNVIFTPGSTATTSGTVTLTTNGTPSSLVITLSGAGSTAKANPGTGVLSASSTSLSFVNTAVGGTGAQSVSLTNTGTAAVNISTATISSGAASFAIVGGSPSGSIPVGQSTSVQVQFAPKSGGAVTGSMTITSDASDSPLTIPLSGTGTQAHLSATPSSVNFGTVVRGTSNSQTITLQNTGNSPLTFSQVTPSGTGFTITGISTSTVIPPGGSVTFNVIFTPGSTATTNGSVTLATNGTPSSLVITLSGAGSTATVQLGANPTSLSFNTVQVGNSSSLTSTLTNGGNSNINISGMTVTGAATGTGLTAGGISAGTILMPGQSATVTVTFAPTAATVLTGASVQIASNSTNSPTTISLSGTGQAQPRSHSVTLSWNPSVTSGVSGYNIYRATTSGGYGTTPVNPSPVSGVTYTDTSVVSGQTYFYVATAVDAGTQSTDSNEVQAIIP